MLKKILLLLAGLSVLLLPGCRGGFLVFKGTHEQQDKALLDKLSEKYPRMNFTCTGQSEGAVHTVEDAEGVRFPAWTAAKGDGSFQIIDYYLEEWLRAKGYFESLEEHLAERGLSYGYGDYNHYEGHFEFDLGHLDTEEELEGAVKTLDFIKAEFDRLRPEFEEATGQRDLMLYFHGSFTYRGGEHFGMFHVSMREEDVWEREYAYDDYEAVLREIIDNIDNEEEAPDKN